LQNLRLSDGCSKGIDLRLLPPLASGAPVSLRRAPPAAVRRRAPAAPPPAERPARSRWLWSAIAAAVALSMSALCWREPAAGGSYATDAGGAAPKRRRARQHQRRERKQSTFRLDSESCAAGHRCLTV
jgi:hypothetical protein